MSHGLAADVSSAAGTHRQRARHVLGLVAAGSALWLAGLLGTDVEAPTVDPDRTVCGSVATVLRTQSGYGGGEMRPDEAAFDRRCVENARQRLWTAIPPGLGLAGSSLALIALRQRRRREVRVLQPFG